MSRTLRIDNEMKLAKEQQKRGFRIQIFILLILIIAPIFTIFQDASASAFRWQEDRLLLAYPDGSSAEMLYEHVTAIEYRESFDFGTPVSGGTESKCKFGLWNNKEFGDYQACCHIDIPGCIIFTTVDTHFVISFESPETTQALYESVRSMLLEKDHLLE